RTSKPAWPISRLPPKSLRPARETKMSDRAPAGATTGFRLPLLAIALAAGLVPLGKSSRAQSTATDLPAGVYRGEADYKQAPAGSYALDPDHAAVIARVSHIGYSYSIFRFDRVSATLKWDPDNSAGDSLTARVDTASITSNVKGFGEQLA